MNRNQLIAAAKVLYTMDGATRESMLKATVAKYLSAEALEFNRARKAGENPARIAATQALTPAGKELAHRIGSNAVRLMMASPQLRQLGDRTLNLVVELLKDLPATQATSLPAPPLKVVVQ